MREEELSQKYQRKAKGIGAHDGWCLGLSPFLTSLAWQCEGHCSLAQGNEKGAGRQMEGTPFRFYFLKSVIPTQAAGSSATHTGVGHIGSNDLCLIVLEAQDQETVRFLSDEDRLPGS